MRSTALTAILAGALLATVTAAQEKKAPPKKPAAFLDAKEAGIDFVLQGEYAGKDLGCQVIALGNGHFQAVLLPGGLPGAGWDGKSKMLMDGKLEGERVVFVPASGKRKYLAGAPQDFSATASFPPAAQKDCRAELYNGTLAGKIDGGASFELKRAQRVSPTLGAAPPPGAIVLFDGSSTDEWKSGKIDNRLLAVPASTKRSFKDFKLHIELRTPFQPTARGQGRGNSGVYLHGRNEIQVLDSFGLDGRNNECGGLYGKKEPSVNMCLPPLSWQTFDVEHRTEPPDPATKKQQARLSVWHNGVKVHDAIALPVSQGPINLQNHGNPVFYRNIWLVELP